MYNFKIALLLCRCSVFPWIIIEEANILTKLLIVPSELADCNRWLST